MQRPFPCPERASGLVAGEHYNLQTTGHLPDYLLVRVEKASKADAAELMERFRDLACSTHIDTSSYVGQ
jgi:hypothetical protein